MLIIICSGALIKNVCIPGASDWFYGPIIIIEKILNFLAVIE
jgi:hypothetical protein